MSPVQVCFCALLVSAAAGQQHSSTGSRLASWARDLAESPELGPTVEKALSRALGRPAIATAAFVIAVITLFKVSILYNKIGLNPFETLFDIFGLGLIKHDLVSEYDGRYEPTEYVHHVPEYDYGYSQHGDSYGHHDLHGDVVGYARSHDQSVHHSGHESRHRAPTKTVSFSHDSKHGDSFNHDSKHGDSFSHDSKHGDSFSHGSQYVETTSKPGRVLFS
ncbi:hypothetical protein FJT64_019981 [Amphibalanus amphitrite]|uniref:Uncharacterized protein n=1 Tax=Amphibalanus amphitrite TaxID=1232801 RepID=A0A6A4X1W3_AMPAM|nr:hypothetical protein FJT64_019981 [Amphibalanus amphitrite]